MVSSNRAQVNLRCGPEKGPHKSKYFEHVIAEIVGVEEVVVSQNLLFFEITRKGAFDFPPDKINNLLSVC